MHEESTETTLAQVQRQPEHFLPAAPAMPTVESMVMLAIERGTDTANLERLVALAERVNAQRAEQAFNEAMLSFRKACPPILRKSEAHNDQGKLLYRFADLSEVTKTIDAHLFSNGFSYTWDTDAAAEETIIVCTIHHVAGHKRSARFRARGTGTKIMSPAQIEASVITFGKRHSLLSVLGIVTDLDDDGRRSSPMPTAPADPNAPRVPTRAERQTSDEQSGEESAAGVPRVSADDLNNLAILWRQKISPPETTRAAFAAWCARTVKTDVDLSKLGNWSIDALAACQEALSK